ncbi:olfactomedin [Huso huso]|uniref:Olfactomedin n=1 Tax=Huso huso TaxID=61971 RepID=A0ABR0Z5Q6_HUSHU
MVWALLLLVSQLPLAASSPQRVTGVLRKDACVCQINFSAWDFPVQEFEELLGLFQQCSESLDELKTQTNLTHIKMPLFSAAIKNITEHLSQFEYINNRGLYNPLNFRLLDYEMGDLGTQIADAHKKQALDTSTAQDLNDELSSIRLKVQNMQKYDKFNLLALREHIRKLKNRLESCRTYDKTQLDQCSKVLLSNISSPVVTQLNPYGTSYPFGAWGKESRHGSPELYWVQSLQSSNTYGITLRTYSSFEDFVMSKNHKDISVTSSYTTTYSIQGPGTVLYNESLYYNCYKSPNVCKFDLKTKTFQHVALQDAGHDNKFPYCYYSCYGTTDIDLSVDETGLWAIYATEENYGNIVISKLDSSTLAVVQTWKTKLFKKSVSNAFMVCGVLYATRYLSPKQEEVFYAFDTVTGHDTNTLSVPFEKISSDIQNLHYNPTDQRLYLFNYAYMLAYELTF